MKKRYTVAVDFDGVICHQVSEFVAPHIITDTPVMWAIDWLYGMIQDFDIVIHSCRAKTWRGRRAIRAWLKEHSIGVWYPSPGHVGLEDVVIQWGKPPALIYLDDRAIRFSGTFPSKQEIYNAKPWLK